MPQNKQTVKIALTIDFDPLIQQLRDLADQLEAAQLYSEQDGNKRKWFEGSTIDA